MTTEVIGSNVNTTVNVLLDGCDTCMDDCLLAIFFLHTHQLLLFSASVLKGNFMCGSIDDKGLCDLVADHRDAQLICFHA